MRGDIIPAPAEQKRWIETLAILTTGVIVSWFFSRWTYEVYRFGDLYHYRIFWDQMVSAPQSQILAIQRSKTGSSEPFFGYFAWIFSDFDHDWVMSFVNVFFVASLILLLRKYRFPLILFPLIFTNYYLIILLSSAERLKFGLLVLLVAFLFSGRSRYFLFFVAPFFHLQSLLFMLPIGADVVLSKQVESGRGSQLRRLWAILAVAIGMTVVIGLLSAPLLDKAIGYADESSAIPWQSFVAIILAVICLRSQKGAIVGLVAISFAAIILGGSRVNLVSAILLMAMFIKDGKFFHPVFVSIIFYFSLKGMEFINTYSIYGTGWPDSIGVVS